VGEGERGHTQLWGWTHGRRRWRAAPRPQPSAPPSPSPCPSGAPASGEGAVGPKMMDGSATASPNQQWRMPVLQPPIPAAAVSAASASLPSRSAAQVICHAPSASSSARQRRRSIAAARIELCHWDSEGRLGGRLSFRLSVLVSTIAMTWSRKWCCGEGKVAVGFPLGLGGGSIPRFHPTKILHLGNCGCHLALTTHTTGRSVVGGPSHSRGPPRWVQPASAVCWRGRRGPRRGQRRAAHVEGRGMGHMVRRNRLVRRELHLPGRHVPLSGRGQGGQRAHR